MAPRKAHPKKGNELFSARHELLVAEEKMHLLRDASRGRSVRDRANKIVEQQERINGIKSKIAALVQAEESVQTPIVAATLGPLPSNSDIGTSVVIHQEILGLPITGSGSQETPMAVDSEGNKNDRISNSGNGRETSDSASGGQDESTNDQDDSMSTDEHATQPSDLTGQGESTNDQDDSMSTDEHATQPSDLTEQPESMSLGCHQDLPPDSRDLPTRWEAYNPYAAHNLSQPNGYSMVHEPYSVLQNVVDQEMSDGDNGSQEGQVEVGRTIGSSHMSDGDVQGQSAVTADVTPYFGLERWRDDDLNEDRDAISKSALDGSQSGWKLDLTTCKTEVYSFEFRDYVDDPLSRTPIREEVEGESDDTSLHHKRSLLLHAKVNHVEEQLKSLVERQQQLVQSVSIGFHGDMQAAIDHIAAISKSVDDIQSLEDRVSEDRRSAKGALYIYLSYLHKDDEMRKQSLEKKCQEHIERLSSIDPELYNMEVELRSLRIAKASISVLGARMSSQLAKLVELRPYAEPLMDEGRILDVDSIQANDMDGGKFDIHARDRETPKFTAPHQMLQVGHRNQDDSSGMRRTGKGKVKDESGTLAQDSGPTIQVLPTYIVPNVVAGPSRKDGEDTKAHDNDLEALKEFVRTGDGKGLSYTLRKNVRENVKYLPQAAFFTMESTPIIFEAKGSKRVMCEYHRKGKDTTFKADTLTELHGMAFKGSKSEGDLKKGEGVLKKNELQAPPLVGHLHCGCPAIEVALEFLLWKTSEAFSSNPMVAGTVYRMTDLHMLKPSVRAFWNQTLRNYTGLHNADFFGVDYGTPIYAIRLALNQLHAQIERLKVLGAPVNVTMDFTDKVNFNVSDEVVQYGLEVGAIMTSAQLEAMWEDIIKRQVLPLRMLEVDWD